MIYRILMRPFVLVSKEYVIILSTLIQLFGLSPFSRLLKADWEFVVLWIYVYLPFCLHVMALLVM